MNNEDIVVFGILLFFLLVYLRAIRIFSDMRSWKPIAAKVAGPKSINNEASALVIEYRDESGKTVFATSRSLFTHGSLAPMEERVPYKMGETIHGFVNPANPEMFDVLDHNSEPRDLWIKNISILMCVGCVIYFLYRYTSL